MYVGENTVHGLSLAKVLGIHGTTWSMSSADKEKMDNDIERQW